MRGVRGLSRMLAATNLTPCRTSLLTGRSAHTRRALFVDFPLLPLTFFQPITNIVWEFGRKTDVQHAKYAA